MPFQAMVVEPSPIRSLAADYPFLDKIKTPSKTRCSVSSIYLIFITFTLRYISFLCCSLNIFRIFQQFKEIHYNLSCYSGLNFNRIIHLKFSFVQKYKIHILFAQDFPLLLPIALSILEYAPCSLQSYRLRRQTIFFLMLRYLLLV